MHRVRSLAILPVLVLVAASNDSAWGQTGKPTVTAVTNVASYASGSISPGEMVVIFGSGMGPSGVVGFQLDQTGKIASTLSQVQVLFDESPAPLIYVSAKQISAMVPYGVAGKSSTQVQVVFQGSTSDPFQKSISPSAPGLFTSDSSGRGQVAMTNSDGSYNTSSNPAAPGSYVTFYLTGEGQTNPSGSDGNIAVSTANVALPVTVQIAGRTLQLLYAGSAPDNVNGFAQINAVIPSDLQYGGNLPLVVRVGGVASQSGVTLAVSGAPAPIPGAPQNLSSTANASGQIVLTWMPADGLAARFHVERQIAGAVAFNEIAVVPAPATTFTDAGVAAGVSYLYRIRAESDYGFSAYSGVATGTVPVATLTPPTNFQATAASQTQINLTWNTANTNATKLHIERKTGTAGAYAEIAVFPNTGITYQDTTVQPSTTYAYRMRSEGATGALSSYSGETSGTTPALPLPPSSTLQGTATSSSQVHLSWTSTATGIVRFRVERRTTTAAYSEISQPSPTATSFDDSGLAASTAYSYRMRVETASGMSAYSNEVTVTTLAPPLPPAPTLQGTATSSLQVHLSWSTTATGVVLFSLERRTTTGVYSQISQPTATSTSFDDSGLTGSTTYLYRMRVQTGTGFSPYSNEVTVTTLQPLPAAPTNLQATAISSTQVNLTWTNNAPDATAIRIETQPAGSSTFTDIGAVTTLTSTVVSNLQANTTYSYRVRVQNSAGSSLYSSVATVTTLASPVTVVLVHGINQSGGAMQPLANTLKAILQPSQHFTVDAGFDWGRCANVPLFAFCPSDCSIEEGADELRNYINQKIPPGDIVLVGYSMGGLIARQLLMTTQFSRNRPIALVTLGTPNLGYPYSSIDTVKVCTSLGTEMKGDFRANNGNGEFSSYLLGLNNTWAGSSTAPATGRWLAVAGTSCSVPARFNGSGCPGNDVFSDGVVCDVSARLLFQYRYRPSEDMFSPNFFHSTTSGLLSGLMCDNPPSGSIPLPALYNVGANSDVGLRLARFINGL
jgi:uncharacterized protein (TIGR03437 family)